MTRRLRRGGAALLALALVPGLSACNKQALDPATNLVQADNAAGATKTDAIQARAVVLVKSKNATAAALAGTLINRSDVADTLQTIEIRTAPNAAPITLSPALVINPGQVIAMGTEAHDPLTVQDNGALLVGHFVDMILRFKTAGDINLEVPVEVRDRYYSGVVPATGSGTTATQADRKLSECVTKAGKPSAACAETGAASAKQPKSVIETPEGSATTVTGKAGTTTAPTAKSTDRSTAKRAKPAAADPAAAAPKAAAPKAPAAEPVAEPAGHDPAGPAH